MTMLSISKRSVTKREKGRLVERVDIKDCFNGSTSVIVSPKQSAVFRRYCIRLATLLPYPEKSGRRPEALRATLSDGLPFSDWDLLIYANI
jgi:hypothetical protein